MTEVKRQKNTKFIDALNSIRLGKADEAYEYFKDNIRFTDKIQQVYRGTTFFPTNSEVDIFNKKCLHRLRGESKIYPAKGQGILNPVWTNLPSSLEVKPGAIVQLLYNDFDLGFANGDSATVLETWDEMMLITLMRKRKDLWLKYKTLYNYGFTTKGYRRHKADGELRLMHARLAFSLTVHKAQGLTLDSVQLNLKGIGSSFLKSQSGMLYTALSRVRTPEGLTIVGTPEDIVRCCYVNPKYLPWIK